MLRERGQQADQARGEAGQGGRRHLVEVLQVEHREEAGLVRMDVGAAQHAPFDDLHGSPGFYAASGAASTASGVLATAATTSYKAMGTVRPSLVVVRAPTPAVPSK